MNLNAFLHRLASIPATAFRKPRFGKRPLSGRRRRRVFPPLTVETLEERILLSLSDQPALLLLDPSAKAALDISGNGSVQAPGGTAVVDSKSASAVTVDGNGFLSAGELDTVGSPGRLVAGNGKILATVHAGIASQPDPLASLLVPSQ